MAQLYKALGDETRLTIIKRLAEQEMCVCEINDILNMSQPAVSHHLRILKQAGLVKISREGKWTYYSLNPEVFAEVFKDEADEVILSYAQPIKKIVDGMKPSLIRTSPEVCEELEKKALKCESTNGGDK